jgi:hypothetical protein
VHWKLRRGSSNLVKTSCFVLQSKPESTEGLHFVVAYLLLSSAQFPIVYIEQVSFPLMEESET